MLETQLNAWLKIAAYPNITLTKLEKLLKIACKHDQGSFEVRDEVFIAGEWRVISAKACSYCGYAIK